MLCWLKWWRLLFGVLMRAAARSEGLNKNLCRFTASCKTGLVEGC